MTRRNWPSSTRLTLKIEKCNILRTYKTNENYLKNNKIN